MPNTRYQMMITENPLHKKYQTPGDSDIKYYTFNIQKIPKYQVIIKENPIHPINMKHQIPRIQQQKILYNKHTQQKIKNKK